MGSIIMSVAVVSIGVALGMARGGRLDALRPVLVAGFVIQAFAENVDVTGATSLSVIGMFLLVVGLVKNAPLRGALIAAFGVALNLIVLAINGAVPIRFEALSEAGLIDSTTERSQITSVGHLLELETSDSRLASLGDTIPLGFLNSVISIGDLVTFAGVIVIVSNLIAARRTVGVDVDQVFALPSPEAEAAEQATLELTTDLAAMFGKPVANDHVGVLDIASDDPIIDVSAPKPAPVAAEAERIDLNFNPDDLWADEDSDVRVLGPSTKPNA